MYCSRWHTKWLIFSGIRRYDEIGGRQDFRGTTCKADRDNLCSRDSVNEVDRNAFRRCAMKFKYNGQNIIWIKYCI